MAVLHILILLNFIWLSAQTGAESVVDSKCFEALSQLEKASEKHELMELKKRYARIPRSKDEQPKKIDSNDARRFVNAEDWALAESTLGERAQLFYSERTMLAWSRARDFAMAHASETPTPELMRLLHAEAMQALSFHGFEGRRLKLRFNRGEIDKLEYDRLLKEAFTKDANPSGVEHAKLAGQFRSDPIDDIHHGGSSFSSTGERYFEASELEAVRRSPYMRVIETSVREIEPGKFKADTFYTPPHKVKEEVDLIFKRLHSDLRAVKNDDDLILAVARMQKHLLIVHPFLDGNGRTIRLLGDMIFERHGLPPPVLLREQEISLSVEQIAKDMKTGMRIYVDEKERVLKGTFK